MKGLKDKVVWQISLVLPGVLVYLFTPKKYTTLIRYNLEKGNIQQNAAIFLCDVTFLIECMQTSTIGPN